MSENINFSDNLTFTKVTDTEVREVTFDITETEGLIISTPAAGINPAVTISGDLDITGDLNVAGNTIVNEDTKLSITDKNVLMNVPEEPTAPSGTSTIMNNMVDSAVVTHMGVNFANNAIVPVIFSPPASGTTATGTVLANASGIVTDGTVVTITDAGTGYVVSPTFTFGDAQETPVGNKPVRPSVVADGSGTVVVRDWSDGTIGHAGIIWDETEKAWNLNSPILQDIYEDSPSGNPSTLQDNPRLINIGAPVDDDDAVNLATLTGLELADLSDVTATHSNGFVLKSDGAEWIAGNISISDIDGISTPATSSGYFFWDHTGNSGNGEFTFIDSILASDITGLSAVATSGLINSLNDVNAAPTDQQVLTWDEDALGVGQGAWIATDKIAVGDLDTIQSPSTSPTAKVSTVSDNVSVTADNQFTVTTGGLVSFIATADITLQTDANMTLNAANPILINTGTSTNGEIKAQGDLIFTTDSGDVIIQNVAYPAADGNTLDDSMLFYNSSTGRMEWGILPSSAIQHRIQDTLGTTYVDTQIENDTVVLQAPDIGEPSNGTGVVSNTVGVIVDAGEGRDVLFPGSLVSQIYSDTGMIISTTAGDIDIIPNGLLKLDGYVFPEDTAVRNAGDILIIDPTDTATKKQLTFSSLNMGLNSDVTITGGLLEQQVLISNASGILVNRKLTYSDIDQTTIPTPITTLLTLTDTYDPTGLVPSVSDDLKNKYLRWDEQGTQVIYEDIINAASVNFVGVITDIVPSTTNTKDLGSAALKFRDLYVGNINADTLTGTYTNADGSVTEAMLEQTVQDKLNSLGAVGDATLDGDQTFTGENNFAPTDNNKGFAVTTANGDINLTSATGDINLSSANGNVNITGFSKGIVIDIAYTMLAAGTGTLVIPLGDPLMDGAIVTSCRLNVSSAFNGTTPTITVGSVATGDALMDVDDNDMGSISLSHVHSFYEVDTVADKKQLTAELTLDGATTGAAKLFIEYYVI